MEKTKIFRGRSVRLKEEVVGLMMMMMMILLFFLSSSRFNFFLLFMIFFLIYCGVSSLFSSRETYDILRWRHFFILLQILYNNYIYLLMSGKPVFIYYNV